MTLNVQENTEDIEEILSKLNDDSILHTPGAIFANRRRVVRFLELRQATHVDRLRVGHARTRRPIGHKAMRNVGHHTGR